MPATRQAAGLDGGSQPGRDREMDQQEDRDEHRRHENPWYMRSLTWIRRLYPRLPNRLRHVGPYQEAGARLAGPPPPDPGTRLLNRFWIGRPRLAE